MRTLILLISPILALFANAQVFPPIDLGYATHVPTSVNTTKSGINVGLYNNIRFAQPPTGDLRFRKPRSPPPHEASIQDGRDRLFTSDCVSAAPREVPFPGINGSTWGQEDCLFLNVWVPEGVQPGRDKVPVLHWLYGSAYAFGSKDLLVDGMALMDRIKRPEDKFIYVASNYRMGLYGWSSAADEDMDANIGLHDGVAALEWTKKYISRFGGDPDNVTAVGESAGATMVALMLVAEGGEAELPFQKAFISSPAMLPRRNVTERRRVVFDEVLKSANCSSLDCLRHASPKVLMAANKHVLTDLPGGSGGATFGPSIGLGPFPDGEYVPDAMTVLFREGRFNKQVKGVISGNMAAEGLGLTTEVKTKSDFAQLVRRLVPGASDTTIQRIRALYPYPDTQYQQIANDWTTDAVFGCNSHAIAKAYADIAKRYVFSVPPATHALDLSYLFYMDNTTTPVASVSLAHSFQSQALDFVHGDGVAAHAKAWPVYRNESSSMNITVSGFKKMVDPWAVKPICHQILKVVLDERNGA